MNGRTRASASGAKKRSRSGVERRGATELWAVRWRPCLNSDARRQGPASQTQRRRREPSLGKARSAQRRSQGAVRRLSSSSSKRELSAAGSRRGACSRHVPASASNRRAPARKTPGAAQVARQPPRWNECETFCLVSRLRRTRFRGKRNFHTWL